MKKSKLVSTSQLQKILGAPRIALARLLKAGLPAQSRGTGGKESLFNLEHVAAWLAEERRARKHSEPARSKALTDWREVRARTAELELKEALEKVMDRRAIAVEALVLPLVLSAGFEQVVARWGELPGLIEIASITRRLLEVNLPELSAIQETIAVRVAAVVQKVVAELLPIPFPHSPGAAAPAAGGTA